MLKYETASTQILYRWYWILDQNVMVLLTTGGNAVPKQWQHLHHAIQVAVDTHCWISHLTASDILITISYLDSSPHQTWISSPVLVLLAYLIPFSLFPFLKNGFWIVPIPLRAFLEKLHWIVDGSAVGPCFSQSLLDFPSCFLKTQLSNNVHLP